MAGSLPRLSARAGALGAEVRADRAGWSAHAAGGLRAVSRPTAGSDRGGARKGQRTKSLARRVVRLVETTRANSASASASVLPVTRRSPSKRSTRNCPAPVSSPPPLKTKASSASVALSASMALRSILSPAARAKARISS